MGEIFDRMGGVFRGGLDPLVAFLKFNAAPAGEDAGGGGTTRPPEAQDAPTGAGSTPTPSSTA
jgi:hypothetical protein